MTNPSRLLRIHALCFVLALVAIAGCSSDPRRIRLTSAPADAQLATLREVKGLTVDETRLLYGYFARIRLESVENAPPALAGRTVGELIDEQRRWEQSHANLIAESQQHASSWKARTDRVVREMEATLAVRIVEKLDAEAEGTARGASRLVRVRLTLENVGTRTITELEGAVRFTDVYDRDLFDGTVVLRETLPPGETVERLFELQCSPFLDQETRMHQTRLADTKTIWEPRQILFDDGGVLAVSDE